MPLLDHFHPPLSERCHGEAFHGRWAAALVDSLNMGKLLQGCFAEMQVHISSRVEMDVATFEEGLFHSSGTPDPDGGITTLTAPTLWASPVAELLMPTIPTLVGAIELLSPGNKDRQECGFGCVPLDLEGTYTEARQRNLLA